METIPAPPVGVNPTFDQHEQVEWEHFTQAHAEWLESDEDRIRDNYGPYYDNDDIQAMIWRHRRQVREDHRRRVYNAWLTDLEFEPADEPEGYGTTADPGGYGYSSADMFREQPAPAPEPDPGQPDDYDRIVWRLEARIAELEEARDNLIGQMGQLQSENFRLQRDAKDHARLKDENETLWADVKRLWALTDTIRDQGDRHAQKLHDRIQLLEARAATNGTPEPCPCGCLTLVCQKCGRVPAATT